MAATDTWESLFRERAEEEEHTDGYVEECFRYAEELHKRNLPVVFDFVHLSIYLGMSAEHLRGLVANVELHYRDYYIRKKSGGTRLIEAPDVMLKEAQRWIYINVLCKENAVQDCVHGFMPSFICGDRNRDIVTNAIPHSGHDWLINIDLKDFFHTVKLEKVKGYFETLGYTDEVTKTLIALCTRKGRLPQGAPTSPMLSNIIALQLDKEMLMFCKPRGITYTRYADDMTLSANGDVTMPDLKDIYTIIYKQGFLVNRRKTKVRHAGCRQEVTGLTVTTGVHVPKKYRKEVWRELYFCKKFGVYEHLKTKNTGKGLYKDWLRGRIMFIRHVDPSCENKMLETFNELNWLV